MKFSYVADKPLIENLSLTAEPGATVAIVGPTGAGKTTLVNLVMRFYELDGGVITLDGRDVAQMRRHDLRATIGMVLQDTWLFEGTIRENIAFGNPDATEEQIVEAAKATHVDHFVRSLPDGYDTVVDDEGTSVSAGEKQLLTIARAFLADPTILILDEATSSVDTRTEVLIQKAMAALRSNRTSFVIAHRLSTIRDADTILVMEDGAIVEQGNHEELLDATAPTRSSTTASSWARPPSSTERARPAAYVWTEYNSGRLGIPMTRRLDYPVFDADNHMYESTDAFTKYLPDEYSGLIKYVQVNGRTKIAVKNVISEYIPNPTFNKVAPPGAQEFEFKLKNPDSLTAADQEFQRTPPPKYIESPPAFFEPEARIVTDGRPRH